MSQIGFLIHPLITLLSLCCANQLHADTFYKWIDQEGVTHYGAQAPAEQATTKVRTSEQSTNDATRGDAALESAKKSAQQQAEAQAQKKQADTKTLNEAELAKQLQQNCEQAQKNIDTLKTNPRVREKDAEGNFKFLAPEEHQKRISETQEYLSGNCGKPTTN